MGSPKFTVVIVGGSIAGLGLANMLQLNNIDFIVLEAYPHIAPQVGASLGLLPHGNRILDQLGLFEKVLKLAVPVNHFNFRDENGVLLAEHKNTAQDFVERWVQIARQG
jgi:2-polyprenyl-6-methoxyphenol hydroxylase-like FAD-dependent oxidoreductase